MNTDDNQNAQPFVVSDAKHRIEPYELICHSYPSIHPPSLNYGEHSGRTAT